MGLVLDLAGKIGEKLIGLTEDEIQREIEEFMNSNKLQKMLLKAFDTTEEEMKSKLSFSYNKDKILSLNENTISPEKTVDELYESLKSLLNESIISDDENLKKTAQRRVCCEYLNNARTALELSNILEAVFTNRKAIKDLGTNFDKKISEMKMKNDQNRDKIISEINKPKTDNNLTKLGNKSYYYISIEINQELDEDLLESIKEDNPEIDEAEMDPPKEEQEYPILTLNFDEAIKRNQMEELISDLSDWFDENGIEMFNVLEE